MPTVIKVLGPGCAKCVQTHKKVSGVVEELNWDAEVIKVEDIQEIISAGVLMTPAVMINDEVKITGHVPNDKELKELFAQYM